MNGDLKKLADTLARYVPCGDDEFSRSLRETIGILRTADGEDVGELMAMVDGLIRHHEAMCRDEIEAEQFDEYRASLESALRLLVARVPQWRPIEAAMKDGTEYVLLTSLGVTAGKWWSTSYHGGNFISWRTVTFGDVHPSRVTMYQPLPPAPKEAETS